MDFITLAASKKYTEDTAMGMGAVKGEKGDKGEQGIQGPEGPRGKQGPAGPKGDIGPQGKQGPIGLTGESGKDGFTPYIKNGNWWIDDKDTGKKAVGIDGKNIKISEYQTSSKDGGYNIIKFNDNTEIKIKNGTKGDVGEKGFSPTVSIEQSQNGYKLSITNENEKTKTIEILNGKDGTGIKILGGFDTYEEFEQNISNGEPGDSYLVNGDLYVWDDTQKEWENVGNIQGPQGPKGFDGERGPAGKSGVYVGKEPGEDDVVWIDPDGYPSECPTLEQVQELIDKALSQFDIALSNAIGSGIIE